jgi:predicted KAP-like P-loop ATPase
MLQRLFPRLESGHGPSFESTWRRSARICSAERFPIYFRLSLPVEEFSAAELKSIFALLRTSSKDFGTKLVQYTEEILPDGSSRARILLDRLQDYTQETLSLSEASNLALALFDVGDQLLREEDKQGDFFEIGNKIRVGRIVYQVLRRFEEPERFGILANALRKGAAVNLAAYQIAIFGQEHGKHGARESIPEQQQILNAPHIKELEDLAVQKIRAAATAGSLIKVPELNHVLHLWRELGDESEVRTWVEGVLANDEDLIKVLEGFLITSKSQVLTDRVGKLDYRLDPEWLKPYVDPDTVIEHCRRILKSRTDLSVRQKTALSEFVRAYDLRKAGKDPDPLM